MKPLFDNVRWGELGTAVGSAVAVVYAKTASCGMRPTERLICAIAFGVVVAVAYLRNPKKLAWQPPATPTPETPTATK